MIGGGKSATEVTWGCFREVNFEEFVVSFFVTCKKARTVFDPATLSAEQTRNPASSL